MDQAREHGRYEVEGYADVTGSDVLLYHHIVNLSLGGICIHAATAEPIGAAVDVVLSFPELDARVQLEGEVVWTDGDCEGIQWRHLDSLRRALLERCLARAVTREV